MNTAVINLRVEPRVKREAQKLARQMGLSLSNVLDGLLRQFIQEKSITYQAPEILNEKSRKALERSMADVKAGRNLSPTFSNVKDAIAWLNSPDKKWKNKTANGRKISQRFQEAVQKSPSRDSRSI